MIAQKEEREIVLLRERIYKKHNIKEYIVLNDTVESMFIIDNNFDKQFESLASAKAEVNLAIKLS